MVWHPAKDAVQRLWGRRWIRRVSYVLVAGACIVTVAPWLATRPAVVHWALGRLDTMVQDETGLSLTIGKVEVLPPSDCWVLQDVHLGGDLLTVKRIRSKRSSGPSWVPLTTSTPCGSSTLSCV